MTSGTDIRCSGILMRMVASSFTGFTMRQQNPEIFGGSMEYDIIVHSNEGPEMAIEGVVTDSCNNIPIEEVSIKTTGNASMKSSENGNYLMFHSSGIYELTAKANGYESFTCSVTDLENLTQNIVMVPIIAPSGFTATTVSSTQINLNWDDNGGNESGFKVEYSPDGTTGWAEIGTTDANVNTYDHTDLTCSTTYYYRIRVTNEACDSDYTDVVNASTSACPTSSTTTTTVPPTVSVIPTDSLQCSACFKSAR